MNYEQFYKHKIEDIDVVAVGSEIFYEGQKVGKFEVENNRYVFYIEEPLDYVQVGITIGQDGKLQFTEPEIKKEKCKIIVGEV